MGRHAHVIICAIALAACGPEGGSGPPLQELEDIKLGVTGTEIFLGGVEGTDAMVAVSVREDGFTDVYVCGGDETFASLSRWFCPQDLVRDGDTAFAHRDGWFLSAERGEGVVDGELRAPDGRTFAFSSDLVGGDTRAGTFQHRGGPDNCSGAIVWQSGSGSVQMVGTFCFDNGHTEQVTPILSRMPAPDAAVIRVRAGEGAAGEDVLMVHTEL